MINVQITGMKRLRDDMGRFVKGSTQATHEHTGEIVQKITDRAKQYANEGFYSTGYLASTIRSIQLKRAGDETIWSVEAGAPYARIVEEGSKPHTIFGNPLLVFWWAREGKKVIARRVEHPGFKGKWFMRRALKDYEKEFVEGMRIRIQDLVKRVGGK